jgi:uncharacterized protein YeeX (DUF496 family)
MSNIYELTGQFIDLQNMLEDADGDMVEAIRDTLGAISGEIGDAVEQSAKWIRNLEGEAVALNAEIERLNNRKRSIENKISSIREAVKCCMAAANLDKVKTALFTISIAQGRESVAISDESLVPDDFVVVNTVIQPNKTEISNAIKAGQQVPGCALVRGEPSLRIK